MTRDDIAWFKEQFAGWITPALQGTPLTIDLMAAVACQETGPVWSRLRRRGLPVQEIPAVAWATPSTPPAAAAPFPVNRAALVATSRWRSHVRIARAALERMSPLVPGYTSVVRQPHKFCHAFGIFHDLQFFRPTRAFLERRYEDFPASLAKAVQELKRGLTRNGLAGKDRVRIWSW
ncbi:MAG: hypothetical protein R2712_08010 [Vicinamibacterales bacterium]